MSAFFFCCPVNNLTFFFAAKLWTQPSPSRASRPRFRLLNLPAPNPPSRLRTGLRPTRIRHHRPGILLRVLTPPSPTNPRFLRPGSRPMKVLASQRLPWSLQKPSRRHQPPRLRKNRERLSRTPKSRNRLQLKPGYQLRRHLQRARSRLLLLPGFLLRHHLPGSQRRPPWLPLHRAAKAKCPAAAAGPIVSKPASSRRSCRQHDIPVQTSSWQSWGSLGQFVTDWNQADHCEVTSSTVQAARQNPLVGQPPAATPKSVAARMYQARVAMFEADQATEVRKIL